MAQTKTAFTRENKLTLALLRREREGAGISQVELAKRLGMTQTRVSKFERGERRIGFADVHFVCRAIGLTISEFSAKFDSVLKDPAACRRLLSRKSA